MTFVPKGIIPPIITPLTDEGEVNYPVLRQMVNHLIDNGVHGLFPLGTTGEFYAFDDDTYRKILETVVDETAGRVPVYGGASHITTRGVIRLVKICEEVGVDAVSVLTPMFVSRHRMSCTITIRQSQKIQHFQSSCITINQRQM